MESRENSPQQQAWEVIVQQKDEIRRLKRAKFFGLIKPVMIAWGVGIVSPMLFQFTIVWLLPKPIRETITIVHGAWSDVALGLQCAARRK
jgi:hypothetical protein